MLKRFLLGALAALCLVSQAAAQSSVLPYWINSSGVKVPTGTGNPLPVTGTFSATLGGFAPATTGAPISVTTGGVTGSLPAGAVVVATNVGTTNGAYCKLGASATTSDQYIAPNGGWFAFTVGANTQLTCITSSSTTTVNMVGGSGLPTGTGGGGGGSGGGGAVTMASGAVASGAYSSGSIASGAFASGSIGAGAFASGAVPSGAYASGSLASGAMVDITNLSTPITPATATATKGALLGGQYNSTQATFTNGQQGSVQLSARGAIMVNPGVETFNVANAGTFATQAAQSGTWNINNVSGTISLPTGAATAANQTTANSSLSTIATLAASPVPCLNATASTTNSYSNGGTNPANCDLNGNLYVNAKLAAGSAVVGDVNLRQGGNALSTTNGIYSNLLQGNAVLSATNGTFANILQGNAVLSATNPSFTRLTDGTNPQVLDPCQTVAPTYTPINIGSATTTRIIAPAASKKTYICSIDLFAFAADNVAIVEGTGGTCGTGTAGVVGGTTTATGISFPAQGGLAKGNGASFVYATAGTNVDFCLITSTTGPLTGGVKWVQQ